MKELIGQTLEQARTSLSTRKKLENKDFRIVRIDSKSMAITDDFSFDRLNLEIENKDGVSIIVNVYGGQNIRVEQIN